MLAESCTGSGPDWPAKLIAAIDTGFRFAAELPGLSQPMTELLLTPYVGRERARRLSLGG